MILQHLTNNLKLLKIRRYIVKVKDGSGAAITKFL